MTFLGGWRQVPLGAGDPRLGGPNTRPGTRLTGSGPFARWWSAVRSPSDCAAGGAGGISRCGARVRGVQGKQWMPLKDLFQHSVIDCFELLSLSVIALWQLRQPPVVNNDGVPIDPPYDVRNRFV